MAALAAAAAAAFGLRTAATAYVAAIAGASSLIPGTGLSAAGYVLGFPGSLSAATLVLAAQLLLRALGAAPWARPSDGFLGCVAASGVVLYLTAGGVVAFDLYDAGYRELGVPALMAAFVVVGWLRRECDVVIWIGAAALLYLLGAFPSVNIWDYLIDPVGFLAAMAALAVRTFFWWRGQALAKRENSETTRS